MLDSENFIVRTRKKDPGTSFRDTKFPCKALREYLSNVLCMPTLGFAKGSTTNFLVEKGGVSVRKFKTFPTEGAGEEPSPAFIDCATRGSPRAFPLGCSHH